MPTPVHPAKALCLKNITTPPTAHAIAQMPISPPLGTNTSANIKIVHAKYKKIANTSHQSIEISKPKTQNLCSNIRLMTCALLILLNAVRYTLNAINDRFTIIPL
jgi:hypothetical protein